METTEERPATFGIARPLPKSPLPTFWRTWRWFFETPDGWQQGDIHDWFRKEDADRLAAQFRRAQRKMGSRGARTMVVEVQHRVLSEVVGDPTHDNPDFDADWNPTPERLARDFADSAV